jgi:acyl-CoA-binding protein
LAKKPSLRRKTAQDDSSKIRNDKFRKLYALHKQGNKKKVIIKIKNTHIYIYIYIYIVWNILRVPLGKK